MTVIRLIARPLLASMFVVGGLDSIRNAKAKAAVAQPVTDKIAPLAQKTVPQFPTDPTTLVRLNGGAQLLAGLALATGRAPRLSSAVLAASLVPTTLAGHPFWAETDPDAKKGQRIQFLKNASMFGGLLLASVDTEGKPGVAWRARRAATDVKRQSRQLAKDARREAKLAKAQLT